jgi:hypothetical protein
MVASRLMKNDNVRRRIAELQKGRAEDLGVHTTDVIRWLHALATFDLRKIASWSTAKEGSVRIKLVPSAKLDDITALAIRGFKVTENGIEVIMREPAAARLIGLHLGMFQGESGGAPPAGRNITNNTAVFIDAPRRESVEEWQKRGNRERDLVEVKPNAS